LTDLTFIEEGNPNFVGPRKLINFKKRRQTAETIRKIQQYQQKSYNLEPVEFIQKKLKSQRVLDDTTLYDCSYYIEPKSGTFHLIFFILICLFFVCLCLFIERYHSFLIIF
jgi:hypothetical protein